MSASAEVHISSSVAQSRRMTGVRVRWCSIASPPRWWRLNQRALVRRFWSLSLVGLRNVAPPKVRKLR
ncbi:MAG: hypothetical protein ACRDTC_11370 [Pseudonocardiaceae bacterium]